MNANEREVLDEGNCGEATDRGEVACDRVRKRRVCLSPPGRDHVKAARLRTETSYKAGSVRRASTTSQSRPQSTDQVNEELVQRNITHLSGETCPAPTSKACLRKVGTPLSNRRRAWQESAEVVVLSFRNQRKQEGPNDEEQGGAIGSLATKEPLAASRPVSFRRRRPRDHRFTIPPGIKRRGARRAASLERKACSALSNRVVPTRMLRGMGRAVSDGGPYPIIRRSDRQLSEFRF